MAYTVKKLSEISKVTVRTLHYYEEAGLLNPAYYGTNGYRYYGENELLQLQQILFFKKLGFSIKKIAQVLGRSDFDTLVALRVHRKSLIQERDQIGQLIETIDSTIKHIQGKKKMKENEFFCGFSLITKGKGIEPYFASEEIVLKSSKNPGREIDKTKREQIAKMMNEIYGKVTNCVERGLLPASEQVQLLVKQHHAMIGQFNNTTKEMYIALADLYERHPEFRKQLDHIHPELAVFFAKAMRTFVGKDRLNTF
jgi:MerR family transcriptional regulator, thiopeptide resistance regulator